MEPPTAAGAARPARGAEPPSDPRLDLVAEVVDLVEGRVRFVRPRDGTAVTPEDDPGAGEAHPPHWAELWPSGVELAHAVSAGDWRGAPVLELGCGLGLPAVAAALAGARVLATDRSADAVTFAAVNAEQNGVSVETAVCAWAQPSALIARAPWRLVLAADVLYGQRNVDELLALLPRLVDDDGAVWVADPGRPPADAFLGVVAATWRRVETVATRRPQVRIHRLTGPPRP